MNYREALAHLDALTNHETAGSFTAGDTDGLTVEPMRRVLAVLGDPERAYPIVHVTGTNGKGSVTAMVAALLEGLGLRVGCYTSPHLQRVNERLRWSGGDIDDETFGRIIGDVASFATVAGVEPTYFETLTAAAFTWFAELPVDVAVVEVGLLGEFDATNAADADVAVITNIGPDHTDFRPGWRQAVAREKAGIIKPQSVVVLGETDPDLRPVFEATDHDAMFVLDEDLVVVDDRDAVGGRLVEIVTPGGRLDELFLPVHGEHQVHNLALAIGAVESLMARPLDPPVARDAIASVRLPARFEILRRNPLVIVDAAHNAAGAAALTATLEAEFHLTGRRVAIVAMLQGRDPNAFFDALELSSYDLVVCCGLDTPRGVDPHELARVCAQFHVETEVITRVRDAVDRVVSVGFDDDVIVVTGSTYLAGAARAVLVDDEA